jgi:hypothetical protein
VAVKFALSAKDMNGQRVVSLGDGLIATDAATYGQVQSAQSAAQAYTDSAVASLSSGQVMKGSVRAAVGTNVTLSAPGTSLDGLTPAAGEIFWLYGQTTGSQNGPYTFNGAAVAMTRATNWDVAGEAVVGSYWVVREGSQADKFLLLTNDTFVLGTTTATVAFFTALAGGAYNSFATAIPAISAGGTGTVTHNLGTRDVGVSIIRNATPYDEPEVRIDRTTVNSIDIKPDVAVSAGDFRVLVWKVG